MLLELTDESACIIEGQQKQGEKEQQDDSISINSATKKPSPPSISAAVKTNESTGIIEGCVVAIHNGKNNTNNDNASNIVNEHDIVLFDSNEAGRKTSNGYHNDKYFIINNDGHYEEHIGNENLIKLIVKTNSDYDKSKSNIHITRKKIALHITSLVKGRFLIRCNKDPKQVDDNDTDVLETPTEEATNVSMKEGEEAISRADVTLGGEKTITTKTTIESKNGSDNNDSNSTAGKSKAKEGDNVKGDSIEKMTTSATTTTTTATTDGVVFVVWEEL